MLVRLVPPHRAEVQNSPRCGPDPAGHRASLWRLGMVEVMKANEITFWLGIALMFYAFIAGQIKRGKGN